MLRDANGAPKEINLVHWEVDGLADLTVCY
jgi:hypothetical protein